MLEKPFGRVAREQKEAFPSILVCESPSRVLIINTLLDCGHVLAHAPDLTTARQR
jgi:hypothetical protein